MNLKNVIGVEINAIPWYKRICNKDLFGIVIVFAEQF